MARARLSACLAFVTAASLLPVAAPASPSPVEPPGSSVSAALAPLDPDAWLRAEAGGLVIEGRRVRADAESLIVAGDRGRVGLATDAIDRIWVEGRESGRLSRAGLVAGVLTGAAFGVGVAAFCVTYGDDCLQAVPIAAGIAGGAGWLLGRVIGGAVPRWKLVHARTPTGGDVRGTSPVAPRGSPPLRILAPRIGSVTAHLGYGVSSDRGAPRGGTLFRAALVGWLQPRTGVGVEVAHAGLGDFEHVSFAAGILRVGLGTGTPRRVEVALAFGVYDWEYDLRRYADLPHDERDTIEKVQFLGGSAGAGGRFPIGGRLYSGVDVRFHHNLQRLDQPRAFALWSVSVGLERAW